MLKIKRIQFYKRKIILIFGCWISNVSNKKEISLHERKGINYIINRYQKIIKTYFIINGPDILIFGL